ncbi:MAG: 50S ribosomal protein L25 [Chloroflexi bacterium]|nr:50S ribosomal protein L25 [Chloroflexota bacterium]
MEGLALKATTRDILGKKTRFLRRQGITPAHLFGHNLKSLALQCNTTELKSIIAQAGTTTLFNLKIGTEKRPRKVLIREIQNDALSQQILHIDFYQIIMTEKIKVEVPIVLVAEAPAMRVKGRLLMQSLTSLSIECSPDKLPPEVKVDLSPLEEVGQAIRVKDLVINPDITITSDPDQLIVKISEEAAAKVEEAVAEAEAEAPVEVAPEQEPTD